MKKIVLNVAREFKSENRFAMASCLVISITIFFIMKVLTREVPL